MKAEISHEGYLTIIAETELESYALGKWASENFNTIDTSTGEHFNTVDGRNMIIDCSLEIIKP